MDNIFETMKGYVLIPLEQYNRLITLDTFAKAASHKADDIVEQCNLIYNKIVEDARNSNNELLNLLFKKDRMGTDSREEQTNLQGNYSGFSKDAKKFLNSVGYTDEFLIEYINQKWDEREKAATQE